MYWILSLFLENEIILVIENIFITHHVGSRTYKNVCNHGFKSIRNLKLIIQNYLKL